MTQINLDQLSSTFGAYQFYDPSAQEFIKHKNIDDRIFSDTSQQSNSPVFLSPLDLEYTVVTPILISRTLKTLSINRSNTVANVTTAVNINNGFMIGSNPDKGREVCFTTPAEIHSGISYPSTNTTTYKYYSVPTEQRDFVPLYVLIPTDFVSIIDYETTFDTATDGVTLVAVDKIIYTDNINYVNKCCFLLTLMNSTKVYSTVKTLDNVDLKIVEKNSWPDSSSLNMHITITGTGVAIAGLQNTSTVINNKMVTYDQFESLLDDLDTLKDDVMQLTIIVGRLDTVIASLKVEQESFGNRLSDLLTKGVSNDTVMQMFNLLTEFGDSVGVPGLNTLSKVVNFVYNTMKDDHSLKLDRHTDQGKIVSIYQNLNEIMAKAVNGDNNVPIIRDALNRIISQGGDDSELIAIVSFIIQDAFGNANFSSIMNETYGDFLNNADNTLGVIPVHAYVQVDESDPHNQGKITRSFNFDVGQDFTNSFGDGLARIMSNQIVVTQYTPETKPDIIFQREKSDFYLSPYKLPAVYRFDQCLEIAKIFQSKWPAYHLTNNNCQHASAALYAVIGQGEIGILNSLIN